MKPKILFIMHMPPPIHGAAMVGQWIHDSKLINEEFDCHYINPTIAKDLQDIARIRIGKIIPFLKLLLNIAKTIIKEQPDLCYFTPTAKRYGFYKSFIIVQWIKLFSRKVVIHFHNKGVSQREHLWLDNKLYRHFFKNIKVILLSEPLFDDVRTYVKREDVYICPNSIKAISPINHTFNKVTFKMLFLSNMMKEKGVLELLNICDVLHKQGRNFECHFVGRWSNVSEEDFRNYVIEHNLGECVFAHGAKYGVEKNAFFEQTDCFVFPTFYHNETFGLVLVEAMQYGIPCISTYEGGIPGVIENGKSGFLVKQHDEDTFVEKIVYLMEHPDIKVRMGEFGRELYQQRFTMEIFENNMKNILTQAIKHYE